MLLTISHTIDHALRVSSHTIYHALREGDKGDEMYIVDDGTYTHTLFFITCKTKPRYSLAIMHFACFKLIIDRIYDGLYYVSWSMINLLYV